MVPPTSALEVPSLPQHPQRGTPLAALGLTLLLVGGGGRWGGQRAPEATLLSRPKPPAAAPPAVVAGGEDPLVPPVPPEPPPAQHSSGREDGGSPPNCPNCGHIALLMHIQTCGFKPPLQAGPFSARPNHGGSLFDVNECLSTPPVISNVCSRNILKCPNLGAFGMSCADPTF